MASKKYITPNRIKDGTYSISYKTQMGIVFFKGGNIVDEIFNELKREAEHAQESLNSNLLYEVYGKAKMARFLGAINKEEFMELNHDTIYFINTNQQALLEGKRLAWDEAKTILWSLLDKWDDKEDKA